MKGLTARQAEIVEFVRGFAAQHGYGPTIREICAAMGISLHAVEDLLKWSRKKGAVTWDPGKARTLRVVTEAAGDRPKHLKTGPLRNP